MTTMAFCEINPFCQQILRQHWPDVPIFDDIRSLTADDLPARPDIICGGYPCQPFSVAGKQRGKEDDRHLWPEMFRLIKECRPAWVIGENVAGHINMGLDDVLSDLEGAGYETQPFVIPACGLNAPHKRERVWVVGYAEHDGSSESPFVREFGKTGAGSQERPEQAVQPERAGRPADNEALAHSESQRIQRHGAGGQQESSAYVRQELSVRSGERSWETHWQAEPGIYRVVDGVPDRVDRIKALGNSLVPQIPEIIGRAIIASMK